MMVGRAGRLAAGMALTLAVAACSTGERDDHNSDVTVVRADDAIPVARPTFVAQPDPIATPSPDATPNGNALDPGEPPTPEETVVQ